MLRICHAQLARGTDQSSIPASAIVRGADGWKDGEALEHLVDLTLIQYRLDSTSSRALS
jgi:hypothetical protein